MKPIARKDGRFEVRIPRKLSGSGKIESRYFPSRSQALKFISGFKSERREHGKGAVTAEERHWIGVVRQELGSLDRLREVLDHWRKTGRAVTPKSVADTVKEFIAFQCSDKLNPGTVQGITWRLHAFAEAFGTEPMHQVPPGSIEKWLKQYTEGWSRYSMYKRIRPLFAYAKRHRLVMPLCCCDGDFGYERGGLDCEFWPARRVWASFA